MSGLYSKQLAFKSSILKQCSLYSSTEIEGYHIISFYRGYRSSVVRAYCWAKKASALFQSELTLITAAGLVTGSLTLKSQFFFTVGAIRKIYFLNVANMR